MKNRLILFIGTTCVLMLSTVEISNATKKVVNNANLVIKSERNETITNNRNCRITSGKVNSSATNNNTNAVMEISGTNAYVEVLNNNIGTVKQNNGTVTTVVNKDVYNQTGGDVISVTNVGEYNIDGAKITNTAINNDDKAVFNIDGEQTHITQINNEAGTVNHINGAVSNVKNRYQENKQQPIYNQCGGIIEKINNEGHYIYRNGTVGKFAQENNKALFSVVDNAEFELTENKVITNGAIILGTSGEEATKGLLKINNGYESLAKIITNANSQLTINKGSTLRALIGTNIMTNSIIDVKGTAHFEGIGNDTENVVVWGGTVKVSDDGVFNAVNVNEADGIGEDDKTHATLEQTGGKSNINAFVTLSKNTNVTGGTFNAQGNVGIYGNITTGDDKAIFNLIGYDSILHIKGGTVTLDGGANFDRVNWGGNLFLDGGTLTLRNIIDNSTEGATHVNKTGFLTAKEGNLFIQGNNVLLNGNDCIYDEVNLKVDGNIEVQEDGAMHVSGDDEYKGKMSVNGGQLFLKNVVTGGDTYLQTETGLVEVKKGSKLVLNDDRDQITFDTVLNLKGDLEINNSNATGVTLNNIGTESNDNWDANIDLRKGILTLENVSKSTTDESKYNQSGGELRLYQTSLTLNEGTKLNGGTVNFGVPVTNPVLLMAASASNSNSNNNVSSTFLRAPARRIKSIETQNSGNIGLLRADSVPIRLRADQNSSELTINNGENNNAKIQVDTNNSDAVINVTGMNSNTNTPTTFTFDEGSNMETGALVIGDDNSNANVVNTSDNTVIQNNVAIAIKSNTQLNVNGNSTQIAFNMNNPKAQFDGTLKQTEGTVTMLGTGEKTGVLKSTGGILNIGDGVTETAIKLNNSNDKISENTFVAVTQNTAFDFSGNKVEVPIENKGTLNIIDGEISAPIKNNIVLTRGARLRAVTVVDETTTNLSGITNINGETSSTAEISQETINIKERAQFSTTANINATNLNFETNGLINIKNSNVISEKLSGDNTNEYKFNNANLFLKNQDTDINGEVTTSGDKVILYINDMKFNDCVNVTSGCNTYLVSGQIGAVTIPWGARLTADNASSAATNSETATVGADTAKSGKLVVEKNDVVKGDLALGDNATIEIQDKTIVFQEKSTLEAWNGGQKEPSTEVPGPYFTRTGNGTLVLSNSNITIPNIGLIKTMDNITLDNSSTLTLGGGSADDFTFAGNVTTIDGKYERYNIISNMTMGNDGSNTVNFKIDLFARSDSNKNYDTFGSNTAKLIAGNGADAVINIADWTLHDEIFGSDAPIDRNISMQIFNFGSTQNGHKFTFTASDKEVLTPIGYYRLNSKGNGLYSFDLTRYNPGVFRGQIVTTAQFQNQLSVNNSVFDHLTTNLKADGNNYVSDKTKDRYLWAKLCGEQEKLHLNQNFDVDNNAYSIILGLDFNPATKNSWSFIPSVFVAYNHAKQKFNENYSSRQDGGQFGVAAMLLNNTFKLGTIAYGGRYTNKMTMPNDVIDKANNWFCGASVKGACDLHISHNIIIQPNISLSYNHFGATDWKTDFGDMNMNLSKLNGISIIPGVNIILQKNIFSFCGSVQYVHGIDKGVDGQAGNVKLPKIKLKNGYMQYGVGIHSCFLKNFSCNLQATMCHLGKTGFGVQAGANWKF